VAAKRKEKYWGEEHNAARRQQYKNDPERAAQVREQRRQSYRRNNAVKEQTLASCIGNVEKVPTSGALMAVRSGDSPFVIGRVFTMTDLANLLDRQAQVIYRWHQRSILPSPTLVDDKGNHYYADDEVTDFIKIMGEHQLITPHYRSDHHDVREKLFAASFEKNTARAHAWIEQKG
jgi:hypothetical protein